MFSVRKKYTFIVSMIAILFIAPYASAKALRLEISPKKISQGDAFFIKVTGVKASQLPSASFMRNRLYFGSCGEGCYLAVGAAGIKTKPGVHTIKLKAGKNKRNLKLSVKKANFPKLELSLPEDRVMLNPADLCRAERENDKLEEIFQTVSDKLWDGSFTSPLENELSTLYGTKRIMNGKWVSVHRGVDIKGQEGEEVRASNNGRVALTEELFFGGNTIILDHGQGIFTMYMHLSGMKVNIGDIVSKGDVIGIVGSSGRSSGPHLHFGAKVTNINVNPVSLMKLAL